MRRKATDLQSSKNRSRVSNGRSLFVLPDVDNRAPLARRFRDILAQILEDLGGVDVLSEAQRQLSRRSAMLGIEAERLEAVAVSGGALDLEAYCNLTNAQGRALQRLGLKRAQREVPTLQQYLAERRGRAE
jgi:hypothetical protein